MLMSKTIKIKELLNMEELPVKIKINGEILKRTEFIDLEALYCNKSETWWTNAMDISLDSEVEIIEEQEEIDIHDINNRLIKLEKMVDRFEYIEKKVETIDAQNGNFQYC